MFQSKTKKRKPDHNGQKLAQIENALQEFQAENLVANPPREDRFETIADNVRNFVSLDWIFRSNLVAYFITKAVIVGIISVSYTHLTLPTIYSV